MTRILIISLVFIFTFSCRETHSNFKYGNPEETKKVLIRLSNGWKLGMNIPKRYDTVAAWKDSPTYNEGVSTRYRFQPRSLKLYKERGIEFMGFPKIDSIYLPVFNDSIDRITVLVPYNFINYRESELAEKNEIYKVHNNQRTEYLKQKRKSILLDTILIINNNYYSVFGFEWNDSLHKSFYKEMITSTIIKGNRIVIINQLATKDYKLHIANFIENTKQQISSIKISYGS